MSTVLLILLLLCAGCATLTPAQSDGLDAAQRLADEVTAAYGVERVKIFVDRNTYENTSFYDSNTSWIMLHPSLLDAERLPWLMARMLASATLGHRPVTDYASESGRARVPQLTFGANRRAVEIMVKFRSMTTREVVERYVADFVARNKTYSADRAAARAMPVSGLMLSGDQRFWSSFGMFLRVPPCDQLRDLWSHFDMPEPSPVCVTTP